MQTLLTIIAFLVIFSVLILVHEWGHFFAARRNGIRVEEFGIGLPPRIWGKKIGEVFYSVNWIPFGGFVRMLGEDPRDKMAKRSPKSFMRKTLWQRTQVVCAGVLMNFILAWVLLSAGFMLGMQPLIVSSDDFLESIRDGRIETVPGEVNDQIFELPRVVVASPVAGLEVGDMILRVNGEELFYGIELSETLNDGQTFSMDVWRDGVEFSFEVTFDSLFADSALYEMSPVVSHVFEETPAFDAGLQIGDQVFAVNGEEVLVAEDIVEIISQDKEPVTYEILRAEEVLSFTMERNEEGLVGVLLGDLLTDPENGFSFYDGMLKTSVMEIHDVQYVWYEAPIQAFSEMKRISVYTAIMVGKVFGNIFMTGDVPDTVAGPVGIAQMTGFYLEEGLVALMRFTALLSLSLGVINIFPFPALDGGRMLFIAYEAVRGKPVDARVEAIIHSIGFLLLMGILLLVTFQDVQRLFTH